MRITLVIAVCVAVVLLGQARISEVQDVLDSGLEVWHVYGLTVRFVLTYYVGITVVISYMWYSVHILNLRINIKMRLQCISHP